MPIKFNVNKQRAVEAVLWIIQNGESNMYNIFKILFSAEKYHLNKYGLPLTGDVYVAMEYGTVPSWLYDVAKSEQRGFGFFKQGVFLNAERNSNTDYLSPSNIYALKHGFDEYAGLDFKTVERKNHEEPAWRKNYICGNGTPIPFEDLIEEDWLRDDLKLESQVAVGINSFRLVKAYFPINVTAKEISILFQTLLALLPLVSGMSTGCSGLILSIM